MRRRKLTAWFVPVSVALCLAACGGGTPSLSVTATPPLAPPTSAAAGGGGGIAPVTVTPPPTFTAIAFVGTAVIGTVTAIARISQTVTSMYTPNPSPNPVASFTAVPPPVPTVPLPSDYAGAATAYNATSAAIRSAYWATNTAFAVAAQNAPTPISGYIYTPVPATATATPGSPAPAPAPTRFGVPSGAYITTVPGVPAITPRNPAAPPGTATYTEQDVRDYVQAHPPVGGRISIYTAPGYTVSRLVLVRADVFALDYGVPLQAPPDTLVYAVEVSGQFTIAGGPYPGVRGFFPLCVVVFDARTGDILTQGTLETSAATASAYRGGGR